MKTEILDEANLRSLYARKQDETTKAIIDKESKLVIRKFNEVANEKNYEVLSHQRDHALKRKEVLYRRSIEFIYKDKRLRNAIPPQEMDDGTGAKRFVSANPKLKKILERKRRKTIAHLPSGPNETKKDKKDGSDLEKIFSKHRQQKLQHEHERIVTPSNRRKHLMQNAIKDSSINQQERRRAFNIMVYQNLEARAGQNKTQIDSVPFVRRAKNDNSTALDKKF